MAKLCIRCSGTGSYLGNGMMITDCELCNAYDEPKSIVPSLDKINRNSKSYQKAVKDIMDASKVARKEAIKMFDEAYIKD